MTAPSTPKTTAASAIDNAYLEVIPQPGIAERLNIVPAGTRLTVTCSPRLGISATLDLVDELQHHDFKVVPHVAARQVRDLAHLKDIVTRLDALGVESVFVPGGDIAKPAGEFESALQVLQAISDMDHRFTEIGIAAHPEGHPIIGDDMLIAALRAKQEFATYMVTQMCFDAGIIERWLDHVREQGIQLPAWLGLPGVIDRNQLFATSLRIGVGQSARFAKRQPKLVRKLLKSGTYQPDELVGELAPLLESLDHRVPGFHFFTFNQFENLMEWRTAVRN